MSHAQRSVCDLHFVHIRATRHTLPSETSPGAGGLSAHVSRKEARNLVDLTLVVRSFCLSRSSLNVLKGVYNDIGATLPHCIF